MSARCRPDHEARLAAVSLPLLFDRQPDVADEIGEESERNAGKIFEHVDRRFGSEDIEKLLRMDVGGIQAGSFEEEHLVVVQSHPLKGRVAALNDPSAGRSKSVKRPGGRGLDFTADEVDPRYEPMISGGDLDDSIDGRIEARHFHVDPD